MPVTYEARGHVGILTLASPERRNAMSSELVASALELLAGETSKRARALVITGEGSAFSAGADIGDLLHSGWMEANPAAATPIELFEALATDRRVIIAAVNGPALGGGFELVLASDLAIAAEDSYFCLPELGHGVIPNSGLPKLSHLVGPRIALEIVLSGRRIPAAEALALGLVNHVGPKADVLEKALDLAEAIVGRAPPGALAAAKLGMRQAQQLDWAEIRASLSRLPRAEWQEGLGAYLERRKPDYEPFWNSDATS